MWMCAPSPPYAWFFVSLWCFMENIASKQKRHEHTRTIKRFWELRAQEWVRAAADQLYEREPPGHVQPAGVQQRAQALWRGRHRGCRFRLPWQHGVSQDALRKAEWHHSLVRGRNNIVAKGAVSLNFGAMIQNPFLAQKEGGGETQSDPYPLRSDMHDHCRHHDPYKIRFLSTYTGDIRHYLWETAKPVTASLSDCRVSRWRSRRMHRWLCRHPSATSGYYLMLYSTPLQ